jgi:hypothetical protein
MLVSLSDPSRLMSSLAAIAASLLLGYPLYVKQVHPIVQILICMSQTTIGLYMLIVPFACTASDGLCSSSCRYWVIGIITLLSLVNVVIPVLGAVVGMGTASGLLVNAFLSTLIDSGYIRTIAVGIAVIAGSTSLFVNRDMILHWQLFAPPVIGGYLAGLVAVEWFGDSEGNDPLFYSVWFAATLISIALHIRRRRVVSWLEKKQAVAVHSKESQIVKVMRSADPKMNVDDFEKLRERLLGEVGGDKEQVDRLIFGGGLY